MSALPSGKKIVLRIGGSVLGSPPQAKLLKGYAEVISEARRVGHSVGVVVGGGPVARAYIATAKELGAYQRLITRYRAAGPGDFPARVTGPLRRKDAGWILHVRCFEAQSKSSPAGGD